MELEWIKVVVPALIGFMASSVVSLFVGARRSVDKEKALYEAAKRLDDQRESALRSLLQIRKSLPSPEDTTLDGMEQVRKGLGSGNSDSRQSTGRSDFIASQVAAHAAFQLWQIQSEASSRGFRELSGWIAALEALRTVQAETPARLPSLTPASTSVNKS